VIAAETQRQFEEALAGVHERDDRERERQAELIREAATAFTDLVNVYGRFVEAVEEHDREREQVRAKLPPNLQHHLDGAGSALLLAPFPVTFVAFVRMLSDAILDTSGRGYREGPLHGFVRLDEREALVALTPDLRGRVRRAELSGRVAKIEH
jgi:hypothetical protein